MRPAFSVRGFCVFPLRHLVLPYAWGLSSTFPVIWTVKSEATHGPGQTFHRCSCLLLFWVWLCPPSSTGTIDRAPQNFQPCFLLCHAHPLFFFFFKQLHLSSSLARKSHASQCRYKAWVPTLKAYISLYSLVPGGRLREEGQGMGSGRSFRLSGFALLKPVLDKSVCHYLLLFTQAVLVPERLGEVTAGTQAKVARGDPAILFSPCFSSFSGRLVTVPSPEFEPLQTPSFNQIT